MSQITIETVGDHAAAAVLAEALTAHGIPVELRRVPGMIYGANKLEVEVRVPAEHCEAARAVLAALSEEAEAAALSESPTTSVEPAEPAAPQAPRRIPRWAYVAAALLLLLMLLRYYGASEGGW